MAVSKRRGSFKPARLSRRVLRMLLSTTPIESARVTAAGLTCKYLGASRRLFPMEPATVPEPFQCGTPLPRKAQLGPNGPRSGHRRFDHRTDTPPRILHLYYTSIISGINSEMQRSPNHLPSTELHLPKPGTRGEACASPGESPLRFSTPHQRSALPEKRLELSLP